MAVKFKDYYEILGVDRSATSDEITKAYRAKARKLHPDVNKAADADERFKELNEAHEVLSDAEKRKRYDQLGSAWHDGDEFTPPPGWTGTHHVDLGDLGDLDGFSDFFASIFGGRARGGFTGFGGGRGQPRARRGVDHAARIELGLEELVAESGSRSIELVDEQGNSRSYDVKLPPGLTDGSRIRLAGQGGGGGGGGPAGDLLLEVALRPHPRFAVQGHDLRTTVAITPAEAVLGGEVDLQTLTGTVTLKIAAGSQSGQTLRLRGQGLRRDANSRGDLLATLQVAVPDDPTDAEREAYTKLREVSKPPETRCRRP